MRAAAQKIEEYDKAKFTAEFWRKWTGDGDNVYTAEEKMEIAMQIGSDIQIPPESALSRNRHTYRLTISATACTAKHRGIPRAAPMGARTPACKTCNSN